MPSTRRMLVVALIATLQVASMSWALVLLGVHGSHDASLEMLRGVTLVLHHENERADHHHHGCHRSSECAPHADDHVVSVSAAPAPLRSSDGDAMAIVPWEAATPVAAADLAPPVWRRLAPASRHHATPQHLRGTTVLLI